MQKAILTRMGDGERLKVDVMDLVDEDVGRSRYAETKITFDTLRHQR